MNPPSAAPIGLQGAWELAARIKAAWRAGTTPDATEALKDNPTLAQNRSVVIDLAYEEFLIRECAGAAPDPARFARNFPDFQASVQDLLEAHCKLVAQPELLEPPLGDWPEVGSTFEGLELRAELGRGAFGRAYLAHDPAIGRLRAVKLAPGGAAEAKLIGGLAHPNVIDVLWARTVNRRTAVCMPFVGAATLADAIAATAARTAPTVQMILDAAQARIAEQRPDSRSEPIVFANDSFLVGACAIGARIADAVAYLHGRGVVHGDIKPTNVVLEPGGSPQVIDFNLAAGEEPATAIRGTPAYMAPELLEATLAGRSAAGLDGPKADLFSLGVTLVEFLTGRHPFRSRSDGTLAALAAAIHAGPPALPRSIPSPIARLLGSCLAVDPADRPASARELTAALDRYVQRERTRGALRKRRVLVLGILALLGALASFAMASPRSERPPDTSEDFFQRGIKLLHDGNPDTARADFLSAHERSGDPKALALAAYCYALSGNHDVAIDRGRRAIADGVTSAELDNNLGYSLAHKKDFDRAILHFDSALAQAPDLQAARYNRAKVGYQLIMKGRHELGPAALADIQKALAIGPASAELHLDAARIFAICSSSDSVLVDRALEQLELAASGGHDPAAFAKDHVLRVHLAKNPRFAALGKRPFQPANPPSRQLKLVEPRL